MQLKTPDSKCAPLHGDSARRRIIRLPVVSIIISIVYWGYIGIMEDTMETTILCRVFIGVI